MTLAINQPYFFPYVGYFQLIASVDVFVPYGNVDFVRKSWINRNRLQAPKGESYYIGLPLVKCPAGTLIGEVVPAANARDELKKLIRRIKIDYGRAPFAAEVISWLSEKLPGAPYRSLHDFNVYWIEAICELLGIRTRIVDEPPALAEIERQLREDHAAEPVVRRLQRIVKVARYVGAREYRNLPGGQELYAHEDFEEQGLRLSFLDLPAVNYPQFSGAGFTPYLSILDTLLHCGVTETAALVNGYRLVAKPEPAVSN